MGTLPSPAFAELGSRVSMPVDRLLRWRAFPGVVRWPLLGGLLLAVVLGLTVPRHAELNPGAAVVWQVWWPLLPFFILATARLWCGLCPFPTLGDTAQRLRASPLPLPPAWLRRAGPWAAAIGLGLLGFLFLVLQIESSGTLTAALLIAFAAGAVATALLWSKRAWCRYVCPLGLMVGLYSRFGWLRLEARDDRRGAAATARRCPVFTSALARQSARDCVLCSECMRGPAGDAVKAQLGMPLVAKLSLTPAEAVAVSLLLGLLLADAFRMVPWYPRYMAWLVPPGDGGYKAVMALSIAGVMALVLVIQAAAAFFLRHGGGFRLSFSRLSLLWLPLTMAALLALSAQHLLAVGDVFQNLKAELGLVTPGHMPSADAYASAWPMRALLGLMVALGGATALYLVHRLAPRGQGQWWAAATVAPVLPMLAVFSQPMATAC